MLTSTLKQIGLEEKQAKIYLACLELGETSIKDIAKKSGVKRTTIYDVIDDMISAGYIKTTTKGNKTRFLAVSPQKLKTILKKREALLNQILPQLNNLSNVEKLRPKVWFFEGIEGLKKAYSDTLSFPGRTNYQWASRDVLGVLGYDWSVGYMEKRARRKVFARAIVPDAPEIRKFKGMDKKHYREIRLIDPKKYPFEIEMDLYGDRVAMISSKDKIAVIVESKPIVKTMKMMHKLCWDSLK